jgi:hypothetical protein
MRWLVVAMFLVGCGGQVSEAPAQDATVDTPALPHAPSKHRPAAIVCPTPPLPPEPDLSAHSFGPSAKFQCKTHAECTDRANGRCIAFDTSPPTEAGGTRCIYSVCNSDDDCGSAVCECGAVANQCLYSNCHVDADCVHVSGFCSPSFDICTHQVTGYWCHNKLDQCIDDSDCDATHFMNNCVIDITTASWVCPRATCGA